MLFCAVVFFDPGSAEARYWAAGLGVALPQDQYNEKNYGFTRWEFDESTNLSLAFGGNLKMFRLEGELSYRKLDFEGVTVVSTGEQQNWGGDQSQIQLMFNALYQFMTRWRVSPFIGAGAGVTRVSWNDVNIVVDDSDMVWTYQAIGGVSVRITDRIYIEGIYNYVVLDDVSIMDISGATGKMDNQELNIISIGLRYQF
jgi:opacity protein-like surface antigen